MSEKVGIDGECFLDAQTLHYDITDRIGVPEALARGVFADPVASLVFVG